MCAKNSWLNKVLVISAERARPSKRRIREIFIYFASAHSACNLYVLSHLLLRSNQEAILYENAAAVAARNSIHLWFPAVVDEPGARKW